MSKERAAAPLFLSLAGTNTIGNTTGRRWSTSLISPLGLASPAPLSTLCGWVSLGSRMGTLSTRTSTSTRDAISRR